MLEYIFSAGSPSKNSLTEDTPGWYELGKDKAEKAAN